MEASAPIRVVILYVHPLLGEGLAKLLDAEPGIAACAIATDDTTGIAAALSARPDAVIVERRAEAAALDLPSGASVPLLLYVDIGGATGPAETPRTDGEPQATRSLGSRVLAGPGARIHASGTHPVTDDLERVVRAVRDLRRTRLALVGA